MVRFVRAFVCACVHTCVREIIYVLGNKQVSLSGRMSDIREYKAVAKTNSEQSVWIFQEAVLCVVPNIYFSKLKYLRVQDIREYPVICIFSKFITSLKYWCFRVLILLVYCPWIHTVLMSLVVLRCKKMMWDRNADGTCVYQQSCPQNNFKQQCWRLSSMKILWRSLLYSLECS
jgi:hypothetical protein